MEDAKAAAQRALIERYERPIYRYLLGAVRDPDAAHDLSQNFAVEFLEGALRHVDPQRGRFRDYVKTVLINMVNRYRKKQGALHPLLDPTKADQAASPLDEPDLDAEFVHDWRDEVLTHTWRALEQWQQQTGQPYYMVLRFRTEHPHVPWAEAAKQLTLELKPDRPFSEEGLRQTKHRASEKFAEFLFDEVARSLHNPTFDKLEEELIELRLLPYCRGTLDRRRQE